MERPTKRSKIGPSPYDENDEETDELEFAPDEINRRRDPGYRLQKCRHLAAVKLKSRFEDIFAKYSKDFTGVADEIDLATGKVVVDNGHLRSLQDSKFDDDDDGGGGAADDVSDSESPPGGGEGSFSLAHHARRAPPLLHGSGTSGLQNTRPPRVGVIAPASMQSDSFGPMVDSFDPMWCPPELPASAWCPARWNGTVRSGKMAWGKALSAIEAGGDVEDDEEDVLLGPAGSLVRHTAHAKQARIEDHDEALGHAGKATPRTEGLSACMPPTRVAERGPSPESGQASGEQIVAISTAQSLGRVDRQSHKHTLESTPESGHAEESLSQSDRSNRPDVGGLGTPAASGGAVLHDKVPRPLSPPVSTLPASSSESFRPRRRSLPLKHKNDDLYMPDSGGHPVRKPSNHRLEVVIVQTKSIPKTKTSTLQNPTPASTPDPVGSPDCEVRSPDLGETGISKRSTVESPTNAPVLPAHKSLATPTVPFIAQKLAVQRRASHETFTRNAQDPAYEFSDEDAPMRTIAVHSLTRGNDNRTTRRPSIATTKTCEQISMSSSSPAAITDHVASTIARRTRSSVKSPESIITTRSDAEPAGDQPGPPDSPPSPSLAQNKRVERSSPAQNGSAPNRPPKPISSPSKPSQPAATVAPASKKQTPKATPCTPQKAKAKPQARPQPKPGCSPGASATPRSVKRSIISLLPDSDSEDELSLGPDAFTPAGSRRMPLFPPFAASRSPASLGRLSPAGSARKSTTKRGLLLVAAAAASSPLRARDAPFPSRLGGVLASLPVRRVQTHTPTGKGARLGWSRTGGVARGGRGATSRLASPVGSEVVQTPGGTARKCGVDGFRCDRDFCFTCL